MLRLFVALPLPPSLRDRLVLLRGGVPGARWVEPEALHLTLRFIGEVDEATAADLDRALDGVTSPTLTLALDGLGTFGKGHRTHTLWAGVARNDGLRHLRDKVESALVRAGRPAEERKFSPHVTLARLNDPSEPRLARFVQENGAFQAGPVEIDRFCLYESRLGRTGSTYDILRDYPLGGWRPDP